MGTKLIFSKMKSRLVPCRLSVEAIGLSVRPNEYPSTHRTNE